MIEFLKKNTSFFSIDFKWLFFKIPCNVSFVKKKKKKDKEILK